MEEERQGWKDEEGVGGATWTRSLSRLSALSRSSSACISFPRKSSFNLRFHDFGFRVQGTGISLGVRDATNPPADNLSSVGVRKCYKASSRQPFINKTFQSLRRWLPPMTMQRKAWRRRVFLKIEGGERDEGLMRAQHTCHSCILGGRLVTPSYSNCPFPSASRAEVGRRAKVLLRLSSS